MSLLNEKHGDTASAAYSITVNRASKIRKLIDARLYIAATRFADHLCFDVLEYIADNGPTIQQAQELTNIAVNARDACRR